MFISSHFNIKILKVEPRKKWAIDSQIYWKYFWLLKLKQIIKKIWNV